MCYDKQGLFPDIERMTIDWKTVALSIKQLSCDVQSLRKRLGKIGTEHGDHQGGAAPTLDRLFRRRNNGEPIIRLMLTKSIDRHASAEENGRARACKPDQASGRSKDNLCEYDHIGL